MHQFIIRLFHPCFIPVRVIQNSRAQPDTKYETCMSTMSKCQKSIQMIFIAALCLGTVVATAPKIDPDVQQGLEMIFLNGTAGGGDSSDAFGSLVGAAGKKGPGCNKGKGPSVASVKSEDSNGLASGVGTGKSCPFSKNGGMNQGARSSNSYSQGTGRASEYLAANQRPRSQSSNWQKNAQFQMDNEMDNDPRSKRQSHSSSTKESSDYSKYSATEMNTEGESRESNNSDSTDHSEPPNSTESESTEIHDSTNQTTESSQSDQLHPTKEQFDSDYICKCKGK